MNRTSIKQLYKQHRKKIKRFLLFCFAFFLIWYAQCLPSKILNDPCSTVLLDNNGKLLGAKIAEDGQWRFSSDSSLPPKFVKCILEFEDRGFYNHIGVSAKGIGRALVQNMRNGRVVSGGSTITMQLARIINKNPKRTVLEKFVEVCMATRLEMRYSKDEILNLYASHAPFGNNVVGLNAASWRYYGRDASKLSWSENATLAVLPNAPGLIYPGKNHDRLLNKRNRLLKRLLINHTIDSVAYSLAIQEPLPGRPLPLPQVAPHLLVRCMKDGLKGKTIHSTIVTEIQQKAEFILENHMLSLKDNKIYNSAVLISSVKNGKVLAYIGNSKSRGTDDNANFVDCVNAPRSTGSTLKPILYAKSLEAGIINPNTFLIDIPTNYGGFTPQNFNYSYEGVVPANDALAKSLNIPFVRLLRTYGYEKFHDDLRKMNLSNLNHPASYYGLSIILGGAESKMWDLNNLYLSHAMHLKGVDSVQLSYQKNVNSFVNFEYIDKACVFQTFEAMTQLNRPDEEGNWQKFDGSVKVAWKTGTSFGFRDAWAIGITPDYVISVWVGNASGEGRPSLTGVKAAAPILFDVLRNLKNSNQWFKPPISSMNIIEICRISGKRAGDACTDKKEMLLPSTCLKSGVCRYHQWILLDKTNVYRVNSMGYNPLEANRKSFLVLSPGIEKYYKLNHPEYKELPPLHKSCSNTNDDQPLALIYPRHNSKIFVPTEINGRAGKVIFEATHRQNNEILYWHIDEYYIGQTSEIHQMHVSPGPGKHILKVIDELGYSKTVFFEITNKVK
jgi:penicillin-binding protein 1C